MFLSRLCLLPFSSSAITLLDDVRQVVLAVSPQTASDAFPLQLSDHKLVGILSRIKLSLSQGMMTSNHILTYYPMQLKRSLRRSHRKRVEQQSKTLLSSAHSLTVTPPPLNRSGMLPPLWFQELFAQSLFEELTTRSLPRCSSRSIMYRK